MDFIFIDKLRLPALVGVYPREQALPQTVEISLRIGLSTAKAGESDRLGDTIDYAKVVQRLRAELTTKRFKLLEKTAEFIAALLREEFSATWVRVSISKLGIMKNVASAGVVIERGKRDLTSEML